MTDSEIHQLLGAYLLGGLDQADHARFEQHVARCPECRREVDELASLPALLDALPVADAVRLASAPAPEWASVPPAVPAALLGELAARRRRARHRLWAAAAALAAACLAGGLVAGPLLSRPAPPDASYSVQSGGGLQVTVGLIKKTWGTELAVDGRSLPADGVFSVWVKDRDGGEDRAMAWTATPSGRVRITGATPLQLASITSVEMRNDQHQTVAVIAVPAVQG